MSENNDSRKVHVEARINVQVVDFRNKTGPKMPDKGYYVSVELTDEELQMKGEAFVAAVRKAMQESFIGENTVMLYRSGPIKPSAESQILGFRQHVDNIVLTENWRFASQESKGQTS